MRFNDESYQNTYSPTGTTGTTIEKHTPDGADPTPTIPGEYADNVPTQPQVDYGRLNDASHPPYQVPTDALQHNGIYVPNPPPHGYPNTPYLQSPNSVQYPYPIPAYVSQQAMTGEHMPQDTDNDQAQPQKQQRKRGMSRTQLIQAMVGYLAHHYFLIKDNTGAYFLQSRSDFTLQSVSADALTIPMKTYAMHTYGKELTDGMIKSAMDLFCGHTPPKASGTIQCGRSFSLLGHVLYYRPSSEHIMELRYNPSLGVHAPPFVETPPALMINRLASSNYVGNAQVPYSLLENLFRGYSVPEGEYLVLITWMVSTLVTASSAFLLELIDDDNERIHKIQQDLKRLIDPCTHDFIPEVPTQRKQFDTLALDHDLLNFSPVDELTVSMQKNLLDLLNGYTVDVGLKPKRYSYSVFVQRPILLSGDESVITHGPLLDRAITLYLSRTTNSESVDTCIPFYDYFSAWLNLSAYVNHHLQPMLLQPATGSNHTPADVFRQIGILVCQALGKDEQLFLREMAHQASTRQELTLSESPVAQALIAYLDDKAIASESKSAIDWLGALNAFSPKRARETDWPATPRALGAALKQAKPVLAAVGIECGGETRGSFRVWTVQRKHDITDDSNE